MGVVPTGTGNDFAGGLGLPTDVDAAVDRALGADTRIDLLRVDDTWAASIATLGFSAAVNARANAMRRPRGSSRYTVATLAELRHLRPLDVHLVLDGRAHELAATLVTLANTSDFGGGMRISPDASFDDGHIDLTVVGAIRRHELLLFFRKVFSGSHMDHPKVTGLRARSVEIRTPGIDVWADGERVGLTPLTVDAISGALRVAGIVRV